jgi:hypothetical protein
MGNKTVRTSPGPDAKVIFQSMLMSDLHLESDNVILPEFSIVALILMLSLVILEDQVYYLYKSSYSLNVKDLNISFM